MVVQVNGYALTWSIQNDNGAVFLHFVTGQQLQVPVNSAQELAALADILRTSPNVFFEPNGQVLSTPVKPPGSA